MGDLERDLEREQKSLLNTFPFNQEQESNHHHHGEHAKLQHNSLFPFKAAEAEEDVEDTTDTISINDFQDVELEVGSLDLNTVGAEEGQEEEGEEVGGGGAVAGAAGGGVASSRNMHQLRFARWLRMNRKHRSEIQLSDLGVIGPVRMLNMISALHASVLARLLRDELALEEVAD